MAWTGVLGLAVGSVSAYASVHGSKLYVFPCSVTSAFLRSHSRILTKVTQFLYSDGVASGGKANNGRGRRE